MTKKKVIVTHPFGNEFLRGVVRGVKDKDMLAAFVTSVATFPDTGLYNISGKVNALHELHKRSFDVDLQPYTYTYGLKEIGRQLAGKAGFLKLTTHETGKFSVDKVCEYIDRKTADLIKSGKLKNTAAVYAYEDGAYYSFMESKKNNMICIYDLPIGYWKAARRLMKEEINRWPEWASTVLAFKDSDEKLIRKDAEIAESDHIIVASTFTASTLKDYPGKLPKISVIPYAFPKVVEGKIYNNANRLLKILFVGGLSQRKGIANLFEAVKYFPGQIELTIVGRKMGGYCEALEKELIKYTYIPTLPHNKILELMRTQDVFVFPSLFEGFGLVITEAMSQGVPVITTDRTAGLDLITDNENGWLVEAGNTDALKAALEKILLNRNLIKENGLAALETAKQRDWKLYGEEVAEKISEIIN
ncbi:glycosyltransferase family 4 protein [Flavobacterium rhizosphaerae]|uniref:Glycosyltransferase family 4 protein n=1 Tax=Flavobacterium rhizosphaerae TaxID=3163298 RepID=A0ABW8YXG6_9FLAO